MANQERFKAQQVQPLFADGRELRTAGRGHARPRRSARATRTFTRARSTAGGRRLSRLRSKSPRPLSAAGSSGSTSTVPRATVWAAPATASWPSEPSRSGRQVGSRRPPSPAIRPWSERPDGHIFNTITSGIRTMPPYGDQIPERDRWAIISRTSARCNAASTPGSKTCRRSCGRSYANGARRERTAGIVNSGCSIDIPAETRRVQERAPRAAALAGVSAGLACWRACSSASAAAGTRFSGPTC